jgi:hypothetical protein
VIKSALMNRRSFLKAFTGAVTGAGVLAYTPKSTHQYTLNEDLFRWHQSRILRTHGPHLSELRHYADSISGQWMETATGAMIQARSQGALK